MTLDRRLLFVETQHSDPDIACCQVPQEIETGLTKTTLWETMMTYDNYGKPAIFLSTVDQLPTAIFKSRLHNEKEDISAKNGPTSCSSQPKMPLLQFLSGLGFLMAQVWVVKN